MAFLLTGCTPEAPAASVATERPPTFVTASRNDCSACSASGSIVGVAVVTHEAAIDIWVRFAQPPAPGAHLWLWFEAQPAHPVLLEHLGEGWRATVPEAAPVAITDLSLRDEDGDLAIAVGSMAPGEGVAVVAGSGTRIPAHGYLSDHTPTIITADGSLAARLSEAVAALQSGFPGLDSAQQALARLTLARQLTAGTYHYDLAFADRPELRLTAQLSVRYPELAQHIYVELDDGPELAQSLFVLADGTTVCTWMTDGSAVCEAGEQPLPVMGVVGMVAAPSQVVVRPSAARAVLDQTAGCWQVVSSVDAGPPEGESCALADGVLAVNDNLRTGHRVVLTARADAVDDDAFVVP